MLEHLTLHYEVTNQPLLKQRLFIDPQQATLLLVLPQQSACVSTLAATCWLVRLPQVQAMLVQSYVRKATYLAQATALIPCVLTVKPLME